MGTGDEIAPRLVRIFPLQRKGNGLVKELICFHNKLFIYKGVPPLYDKRRTLQGWVLNPQYFTKRFLTGGLLAPLSLGRLI
jgi:hypothetical protein